MSDQSLCQGGEGRWLERETDQDESRVQCDDHPALQKAFVLHDDSQVWEANAGRKQVCVSCPGPSP